MDATRPMSLLKMSLMNSTKGPTPMTSAAPPLRPGVQLASAVCGTRVVVIRIPGDRVPEIACGGQPMVAAEGAQAPAASGSGGGSGPGSGGGAPATLLGKRYVDAGGTVELLCSAAGPGRLTCDGAEMTVKSAKPLPASD
jgi:hypothetical protein